MKKTLAILCLPLVLSGCLSTPYQRPDVPTPSSFAHGSSAMAAGTEADADWWRAFGDERLDRLMTAVLANNDDLAAAALRVRQAREQAGLTRLDQWPSASGSVGATGGDGATRYSANVSIAYEADLWGRLGNATKAAEWAARATDADREAARLALIGTVCQLYWDIAYSHERITAAEASLAYAQKVLELVTVQHTAGSVSGLELAEARQSVASQTASLSQLQQDLVADRNALTVLLGGTTWPEGDEPQALPDAPLPDVAAGLPAELLARRPDLRAAELRLRQSLAEVDISRAQLYPTLSLTASGGGSSTELGQVLSNATGSIGASLSLPFLDLPRRAQAVKVSKTQYEIDVRTFRTTLLTALSETDTALSNRAQLAAQGQALNASLAEARRVEGLYAIRYRAGTVPLRTWLDAQESLRQSELNVSANRLSQLGNLSTLFQVLGGNTTQ